MIADELRELAESKREAAASHEKRNRWTHKLEGEAAALEAVVLVLEHFARTRVNFTWAQPVALSRRDASVLNALRDAARRDATS